MTHFLKTLPEYFRAQESGAKQFEVRKDDRSPGFAVGDTLVLQEWSRELFATDRSLGWFTGNELQRRVTYILRESPGLQPGYVVIGTAEWRAA